MNPAQPSIAAIPPGPQTRMNAALLSMGEKRTVLTKPGQVALDDRPEHRTALIATAVGDVRLPACSKCDAGLGPFVSCVTVPNQFVGVCNNCIYRGRRKECTLRNGKSSLIIANSLSLSTHSNRSK